MSQIDGVTKTIGPDTYKIMMLDPLTSGDLLLDLTDIFGPALSAVGSALGSSVLKSSDPKAAIKQLLDGEGDGAGLDVLGDNLERALVQLINKLDKAKQREIIGLLTSVTSVKKGENEWPSLDSIFTVHFQGRIKAMYQWLVFAVRTQYGDFF